MLVPYSTYQVVEAPFGLTLPETVAEVGPTAVTGPVVAVGAEAAAAAPTPARAETAKAVPIAATLNILRRVIPAKCRTPCGRVRGFADLLRRHLARSDVRDEFGGPLDGEDVGVDNEIVVRRQLLVDVVEALQVVAPTGIRILHRTSGTRLIEPFRAADA